MLYGVTEQPSQIRKKILKRGTIGGEHVGSGRKHDRMFIAHCL
jgi:hypothetical protein